MNYSALSLFSGCGGFCEGVRLAGFNVEGAVEVDRFAAATYRHNFPEVPLYEGDVRDFRQVDSDAWADHADRFAALDSTIIDLVFGGPPCQGYSQIGTRLIDDPRNELYGEFVRILGDIKPRVFIMENVPNMLLMSKGIFKRRALAAFVEAGYSNCDVRVVSAHDFGVPQTRERAFFVGVRDGIDFPVAIGDWLTAVLPTLEEPGLTVGAAIGDLPKAVSADDSPLPYESTRKRNRFLSEMRLDREGAHYAKAPKLRGVPRLLHNHHTKEIQERRSQLIRLLEPGKKADSLPKEIWDGRRPEKWRRFHPDWPAHTLLAQMHRDLSEWVHPEHHRWITVREAARLQSFHDGFVFKSSEWQMLKQIGNAVPPLLGNAIAQAARLALSAIDTQNFNAIDFAGAPVPLRLAV